MKRVGEMRLNEFGRDWIWVRETDTSTAHALSRISDRYWAMCSCSWGDGYQIVRDLELAEKCEICVRLVVLEEFCS